MTTTDPSDVAATVAVSDEPAPGTVPPPTDVPLRIDGDLALRLTWASRWQ